MLSVIATALLLILVASGAETELYSLEASFEIGPDSFFSLHPIWVVYVDRCHWILSGNQGIAQFNIAVVGRPTDEPLWFLIEHEVRHTRQFRALGLWIVPLYIIDSLLNGSFMNFEGVIPDNRFEEAIRQGVHLGEDFFQWQLDLMWTPPAGWPPTWSFLRIREP